MVLPFLLFASPAILISVLIVTGTLTICTLFCPFTHPVKYPVNTKTLYCHSIWVESPPLSYPPKAYVEYILFQIKILLLYDDMLIIFTQKKFFTPLNPTNILFRPFVQHLTNSTFLLICIDCTTFL